MKYFFLLNKCVALKFSGQNFSKTLESVDWTPFHPMYHFAVAVLEDRFEEAEKLMRSEAVQERICQEQFAEWPILKEFRKTEAFANAYFDIFKEKFEDVVLKDVQQNIKAQQDGADNGDKRRV